MFGKIWMRLGKFVQSILNKFKKKKSQDTSLIGKNVQLNKGEVFIDGVPFGTVKSIETISLSDLNDEDTFPISSWNADFIGLTEILDPKSLEMLQKLANTSKPDLPKRYLVKTLIVSCYTSWPYDAIGVDLSQLEETGIAHYFCMSTKPMEAYSDIYGDIIEIEGESASAVFPNATLFEWSDGTWSWEL